MNIRVVLVDDHAIVRTGLRAVLSAAPDIEVVGEASGGHEAVELVSRTPADVVVMDLSMSAGDGLMATRAITGRSNRAPNVLVLTMHSEEAYLEAALEAGASRYLVKSTADRELVEAVRAVARGEEWVQPSPPRVLARGVRRPAGKASHRARDDNVTSPQH